MHLINNTTQRPNINANGRIIPHYSAFFSLLAFSLFLWALDLTAWSILRVMMGARGPMAVIPKCMRS